MDNLETRATLGTRAHKTQTETNKTNKTQLRKLKTSVNNADLTKQERL